MQHMLAVGGEPGMVAARRSPDEPPRRRYDRDVGKSLGRTRVSSKDGCSTVVLICFTCPVNRRDSYVTGS